MSTLVFLGGKRLSENTEQKKNTTNGLRGLLDLCFLSLHSWCKGVSETAWAWIAVFSGGKNGSLHRLVVMARREGTGTWWCLEVQPSGCGNMK